MEYNRMVAYIYSYNDGMKSKNTGFAKLEVRQNVLKLQINMKGAYSDSSTPWSVNLFYREKGRIRGIRLGGIAIKNGMGEFRYTGNAENIEGSSIAFPSVKGLYIGCDGSSHRMYASEWDDLGFLPDSVESVGENAAGNAPVVEFVRPEEIGQPDKPSLFAGSEGARPESAEPATAQPERESARPEAAGAQIEFATALAEAIEGSRTAEKEMPEQAVLAAAEVADGAGDGQSGDRQEDPSGSEILDRIIDAREKTFLFADDDLYDVVEIGTDDIAGFPEADQGLANNSFVNHGYYNFRHLILGRIRDSGGCGYFIGVPGVYTRRDRNTASMFGFQYFKFSMRSDVRLGQFGYWYRQLHC